MNSRQRFLETLLFGKPDRIPLDPGEGRRSTIDAWHCQGLPRGVRNIAEYAYRQAGGRLTWPEPDAQFHIQERMIPQFEEKVIEKRKDTQIVQDWKGNICEISNQFTTDYLREPIDFVTRRWIRCPVEKYEDWEQMRLRYNPDDQSRFPRAARELGKSLSQRSGVLEITFSGPFWQLREWLGFENLCTLFYDESEWINDMIVFWRDYIGKLLERMFSYVTPDVVHISEDMAYKGHSMISPTMVREHLFETYRYWGDLIHNAGCPLYDIDSDGYIADLIPIWIEAGVNVCDPIEVAAGNDIIEYRRQFGKSMAYRGGVDKRAIAKGGTVIETEVHRLIEVIGEGGYIPSCDHGVPSDISWDNFVRYVQLLGQATGWL